MQRPVQHTLTTVSISLLKYQRNMIFYEKARLIQLVIYRVAKPPKHNDIYGSKFLLKIVLIYLQTVIVYVKGCASTHVY